MDGTTIDPPPPRRPPRVYDEEEVNAELSACSSRGDAASDEDWGATNGEDNFEPHEIDRLLCAAAKHSPRANLALHLLFSTGLRRQGVLNIRVADVADDSNPWNALPIGSTLTKGRRRHEFILEPPVATCLEAWLNTTEEEGGRPLTPSPFLFPSGSNDSGQMSTTALSNLFKEVCRAAGFVTDPRAPRFDRRTHLHATRHSYAHELMEAGNPITSVAAALESGCY